MPAAPRFVNVIRGGKVKLQKIALAINIAIVMNALLFFAGVVMFGRPEYKDFCPEYVTQNTCEESGFEWNGDRDICETSRAHQTSCRDKLNDAWGLYDNRMFALRIAVGTFVLVVGLFSGIGGVSTGLILGGLGSITIGSWVYWMWDYPTIKLVALSIAMVSLIITGYKKFK